MYCDPVTWPDSLVWILLTFVISIRKWEFILKPGVSLVESSWDRHMRTYFEIQVHERAYIHMLVFTRVRPHGMWILSTHVTIHVWLLVILTSHNLIPLDASFWGCYGIFHMNMWHRLSHNELPDEAFHPHLCLDLVIASCSFWFVWINDRLIDILLCKLFTAKTDTLEDCDNALLWTP